MGRKGRMRPVHLPVSPVVLLPSEHDCLVQRVFQHRMTAILDRNSGLPISEVMMPLADLARLDLRELALTQQTMAASAVLTLQHYPDVPARVVSWHWSCC